MKILLLALLLLSPLTTQAEHSAGVSCQAYANHNLFGRMSSYSSCRSCHQLNRGDRSIDCVQTCQSTRQECSVYSMDVGAGGMTQFHKATAPTAADAETQARALCEMSIAGKSAAFCGAGASCNAVVEDLGERDCR